MLQQQYQDYVLDKLNTTGVDTLDFPNPPSTTPLVRWQALTQKQRVRTKLRKSFLPIITAGEVDGESIGLTDEDFLQILYKEKNLTETDAQTIVTLWNNSILNDKNPTREQLIQEVVAAREEERPLTFYLSQCIGKDPSVRIGKMDYFCNGKKTDGTNRFLTGIQKKGWSEYKQLLNSVSYPTQANLLLGDTELWLLDQCDKWCSAEQLELLEMELKEVERTVQIEADTFFGEGRVQVSRWQNIYEQSAYESYQDHLNRARSDRSWLTSKLRKESIYPYINSLGYPQLASQLGVNRDDLTTFIINDVMRTAAQYRVEANIVSAQKGIQLWSTITNPKWPLSISNFDGVGLPPSLILNANQS